MPTEGLCSNATKWSRNSSPSDHGSGVQERTPVARPGAEREQASATQMVTVDLKWIAGHLHEMTNQGGVSLPVVCLPWRRSVESVSR